MYKLLWFISNSLFVVSVILFLVFKNQAKWRKEEGNEDSSRKAMRLARVFQWLFIVFMLIMVYMVFMVLRASSI
jgi:Na+/H+ antiporter NhaD/arsenite permease-like protein